MTGDVYLHRAALRVGLILTLAGTLPAGLAQGPSAPGASAPGASAPGAAAPGVPANAAEVMQTERFRRLAAELRCLVCQNQSLVDSNAPLAQDLRREVVNLMASGRDDGQIKSFLVDRYGEFVLYRPALSLRNSLLWFGPFLLLAIVVIAWWRLGRRRPAGAQSAQDALKHVDELLGR